MVLLEYWPEQPHHLLKAGGRTLKAGDTFEASKKDAKELLPYAEVRLAEATPDPKSSEDKSHDDAPEDIPQAHSPDRTQRVTTIDRRP